MLLLTSSLGGKVSACIAKTMHVKLSLPVPLVLIGAMTDLIKPTTLTNMCLLIFSSGYSKSCGIVKKGLGNGGVPVIEAMASEEEESIKSMAPEGKSQAEPTRKQMLARVAESSSEQHRKEYQL